MSGDSGLTIRLLGPLDVSMGGHTVTLTSARLRTLHAEIGDRRFAAENRVHIGDAHHAAGDQDAAHEAWRRALPILEELDHPDAQLVRANLKLRADQP